MTESQLSEIKPQVGQSINNFCQKEINHSETKIIKKFNDLLSQNPEEDIRIDVDSYIIANADNIQVGSDSQNAKVYYSIIYISKERIYQTQKRFSEIRNFQYDLNKNQSNFFSGIVPFPTDFSFTQAFNKEWIEERVRKLAKWFHEAKAHISIQYDIREWLNAAQPHSQYFYWFSRSLIIEFNVSSQKWQVRRLNLTHHLEFFKSKIIVSNNSIQIVGGLSGTDSFNTNIYTFKNDQQLKTNYILNTPRMDHAVCEGGGMIFLVGGSSQKGEALASVEILDLVKCENIPTENYLFNCGLMKYSRVNPICTYHDGNVFICGGEYGLLNVEQQNVQSQMWQLVKMSGRIDETYSGMTQIQNKRDHSHYLMVFGGSDRNSISTNKVIVLDIGSKKIIEKKNMKVKDKFKYNMHLKQDSRILVFGEEFQVYDIKTDTWTQVNTPCIFDTGLIDNNYGVASISRLM